MKNLHFLVAFLLLGTLAQKIGHELKYEPPKVLHMLGLHRGHLKAEGRKI